MSKKETEFDRLARMKKMQKEATFERRKSMFFGDDLKKKGKIKNSAEKRADYSDFDDEYEYI